MGAPSLGAASIRDQEFIADQTTVPADPLGVVGETLEQA